MSASTAWIREPNTTYGAGRYPHGRCEVLDCDEPACFAIPLDGGSQRICLDHKPDDIIFLPFLGQQTKLFAATERRVLGGGGAGGSKTYAGSRLWLKQHHMVHAAWEAGQIERSKGWALFLRRTIPELLDVVEDFRGYKDAITPAGRARWSEQKSIWICECGYKVQFGGMEDDGDWKKYYGGQYSLVVIDEAWQFTKKQILEIDGRIRCPDPILGPMVQLYLLTNPVGSETKKWMKRQFVDCAPPEEPTYQEVELADGRILKEWQVYIPSNLFDNPALMRDGRYEANLRKKSAAMKRMLLDNDWTVDEGAWVGDDWDPTRHIIKPHAIPRSWPKFKCGDYGYSSKSSVHWVAVDPSGGLVVYRSWSCKGLTAREVALRIREKERTELWVKRRETGERVMIVPVEWDEDAECTTVRGPMDAALWAKNGEDGESRGEIFEALGTGFYRSDKGTRVRHSAAEQIRWRLRNEVPDPFIEGRFTPSLRFFEGTTETTMFDEDGNKFKTGPIHTIPTLPADANDPDVPDTDADDHDWDALAYGVMSRPMGEPQREAEVLDFMSFRAKKGGGEGSGSAGAINW